MYSKSSKTVVFLVDYKMSKRLQYKHLQYVNPLNSLNIARFHRTTWQPGLISILMILVTPFLLTIPSFSWETM